MKRIFLFFLVLFFLLETFAQNRILSMRIVYEVPIMEGKIQSSTEKDSIVYDYLIDKRYWWESIDLVMKKAREKEIVLRDFNGNAVVFDSMINRLSAAIEHKYNVKFTPEQVQTIIEEDIRAVRFEEKWTYDPETMFIEKQVERFQPIIIKDTILFNGDELYIGERFRYDLAWVEPFETHAAEDTVRICSNIQTTMRIYNAKPYHWWDSHLEAEYSIPFMERFISKAESGELEVFDNPSSLNPLIRPDITRRRQYDKMESIVMLDSLNNEVTKDTVIKIFYEAENIDHFRFGEAWYFDKNGLKFMKSTNYFSPVIDIIGFDGTSRGFYPLYYIRKKQIS